MKLNFFLTCLFTFFTAIAGQDSNNYAILTLLNHGYALPSGQTCSSTEWDTIKATIDGAPNVRRERKLLREQQQQHRQLYSPYFCNKYCKAFAPGTCYLVYPSCSNRRRLSNNDIDKYDGRDLVGGGNTDCSTKISNIKANLSSLMPTLSTDCQAVVNSAQDFFCSEINVITSWNLWNAHDNTIIMTDFENGGFLCRSTEFSIEAVVHDEDRHNYIQEIKFVATGPNGYFHQKWERRGHYMMFGNSGDNVYGGSLDTVGEYAVVATPNGDTNLSRTLTFHVIDC